LNASYYDLICDALSFTADKFDADILGYVIMPNHVHLIIYFKKENHLSAFMRDFKKFTAFQIRKKMESENQSDLLSTLKYDRRDQKFKIWMDRFDDVHLESTYVVEQKLDYIHDNPVKKEFCDYPEDYLYSSAAFYEKGTEGKLKVVHYRDYF
jgi:putative transposase